jgi:hypothetical protein
MPVAASAGFHTLALKCRRARASRSPAVQQQPGGGRLAAGRLPRQGDFQRREHRDVPGEFGRDRLRERDVSGLASFWQGEDEPAADLLDLADDVEGPAEELHVIDREPEDLAQPESAARGERRGHPDRCSGRGSEDPPPQRGRHAVAVLDAVPAVFDVGHRSPPPLQGVEPGPNVVRVIAQVPADAAGRWADPATTPPVQRGDRTPRNRQRRLGSTGELVSSPSSDHLPPSGALAAGRSVACSASVPLRWPASSWVRNSASSSRP